MKIINDEFQILSGSHTVVHSYEEPETIEEALTLYGEAELLKKIHYVIKLEKRSKARAKLPVTFPTAGRGQHSKR
jgi:hypothetical protein